MINLLIIEIKLWFRRKENLFWSIAWPCLWMMFMYFIVGVMPGKNKIEMLQFLLSSAITLVLVSSPFVGLALDIALNKSNMVLKRLMATPFPIYKFFIIKYCACVTYSITSVIVLLTIAFILGLGLDYSIFKLLMVVILGFFTFSSIAFFVAGITKSISSANVLSMFLMFIFMFFSNLFFDLSNLPTLLYNISLFIPSSLVCTSIRDVLNGNQLSIINIVMQIVYGFVTILIAKKFFKYY